MSDTPETDAQERLFYETRPTEWKMARARTKLSRRLERQLNAMQREIELLHARIAVLKDACEWARSSGHLRKRTRPDPIDRALHTENESSSPESQSDPES